MDGTPKLSDQSDEIRDHRGHVVWRTWYEAQDSYVDPLSWHKLTEEVREPWRRAAEVAAQPYYEELVEAHEYLRLIGGVIEDKSFGGLSIHASLLHHLAEALRDRGKSRGHLLDLLRLMGLRQPSPDVTIE